MIHEWLEQRKERKAMKHLSIEMEKGKEKKLEYLKLCQFMDADTPEQMIRFAETLRQYVEQP